MDVDIPSEIHNGNEWTARKNRIQVYKSILNYFRGRSLSLDYILASKQPSINVPPEMRTHEALCKDIQALYDDITLIQSIKNCLKLINCSLTCTEIMSLNDNQFKREIFHKVEGIIYFSKAIMNLYNEHFSDLELIDKMKNYSAVMTEYIKKLDELREKENSGNKEDPVEMDKAKMLVYKINLMRIMKSVLIGYISLNCPNLLRSMRAYKTSVRRDLTVEDFIDSWDAGMTS